MHIAHGKVVMSRTWKWMVERVAYQVSTATHMKRDAIDPRGRRRQQEARSSRHLVHITYEYERASIIGVKTVIIGVSSCFGENCYEPLHLCPSASTGWRVALRRTTYCPFLRNETSAHKPQGSQVKNLRC